MNIWSLQKDDSVKHLLLLLADELPSHVYVISDTSLVTGKAVRLCHASAPKTCAYIYTYGHDENRYGVHLEYPVENDITYSDTIDIVENVGYTRLLDMLKVHFEISEPV